MQSCVFELRLNKKKKKYEEKKTKTSVEAIQRHMCAICGGIPTKLNAIESLNVIACKTEGNHMACSCVVGNRVAMTSIRNDCKRATNYVFKLRKKSSYRDTFKSNLRLSNDMLMHGCMRAYAHCSRPIPANSADLPFYVLLVILFGLLFGLGGFACEKETRFPTAKPATGRTKKKQNTEWCDVWHVFIILV